MRFYFQLGTLLAPAFSLDVFSSNSITAEIIEKANFWQGFARKMFIYCDVSRMGDKVFLRWRLFPFLLYGPF